jgi:Asp/Glu/hydantoin racemase
VTTIGFLHTGAVHVPTFRRLREELAPGWQDLHIVDEELLADARRSGITPALAARVDARLHELADGGADIIVCTCSSLGGHAEGRTPDVGVPVLRADRPMAEEAVAVGRRIAVVVTVPSTLEPTRALLRDAARRGDRDVELVDVRCESAWTHFEAGDLAAYASVIAANARNAAPGVDVILLAQASAAPAAALLADLPIPVLTSPRTAVARAIAEAGPVHQAGL